jgi:hypothetical protein
VCYLSQTFDEHLIERVELWNEHLIHEASGCPEHDGSPPLALVPVWTDAMPPKKRKKELPAPLIGDRVLNLFHQRALELREFFLQSRARIVGGRSLAVSAWTGVERLHEAEPLAKFFEFVHVSSPSGSIAAARMVVRRGTGWKGSYAYWSSGYAVCGDTLSVV